MMATVNGKQVLLMKKGNIFETTLELPKGKLTIAARIPNRGPNFWDIIVYGVE